MGTFNSAKWDGKSTTPEALALACDNCGTPHGVHGLLDNACPAELEVPEAPRELRKKQIGGDHYIGMGMQPWDVVDTWPREQRIGFYRGNVLKYVMRMGSKDADRQEIAKSKHYLEKLLAVLSEEVDQ